MKINTVGKIILKNGQKSYKRFGAAVVQKIKLGTAAFANIVNNATTTEEGFVPDARVVAQQQQLIDQQQEAINSLNSAMSNSRLYVKFAGVSTYKIVGTVNEQRYLLFGARGTSENSFVLSVAFKQSNNNATGGIRNFGGTINAVFDSTSYAINITNGIGVVVVSMNDFTIV